jgi:four helix bundle protein
VIKNFTDLETWKRAHELSVLVLRLTKILPNEYRYTLANQMQRSAVSIGSNIAEGFGRETYKEKVQFYRIARGSIAELQNQLLLARDASLVSSNDIDVAYDLSVQTYKLINGLIRKTIELNQRPLSNVESP